MRSLVTAPVIVFGILILASVAGAQGDDVCRESGEAPNREVARPGRRIAYVYGSVVLKGQSQSGESPRVVVTYSDSLQPGVRQTVGSSGSYCFRMQGIGGKDIGRS